jgi:hypothetical protein
MGRVTMAVATANTALMTATIAPACSAERPNPNVTRRDRPADTVAMRSAGSLPKIFMKVPFRVEVSPW